MRRLSQPQTRRRLVVKRDKILEPPDLLVRALLMRFNNSRRFLHEVRLHVDHDLPVENNPLLEVKLDLVIGEKLTFVDFWDH